MTVVKIRSFFTVEVGDKRLKTHNTLTEEYKYVVQGLMTQGSNFTGYYGYSIHFAPPSSMYFVLLYKGVVVARIPAKLASFNEEFTISSPSSCNNLSQCNMSPMSFSLKYSATDETNNAYKFDEVQLWADNEYAIAYATVGEVTKDANMFIRVTWDANVKLNGNNVLYTPACKNFSLMYNAQVSLSNFQSYVCLNLPYAILVMTLVPYSYLPNNTYAYTVISSLIQVLSLSNIKSLNLQGVTHYVINGVAYPITHPYIILNQNQSNTVTVMLLYGVNDSYFVYTLPLKATLQYYKLYFPTLVINVIEE